MEQFFTFGEEYLENGLIIFLIRTLILYLVVQLLIKGIRKSIQREAEQRGDNARTPIQFIGNVTITLIKTVFVFLVLSDIKPLAGIGRAILGATSLITIIVGLAAQEAFGNLVAGFFLALYQPFRLGDLVTLPGKDISGTVESITLRHTIIKTYDGTQIVVPNSAMNSEVVENKRNENNLISKQIVISVGYDTDIDRAKTIISDTVAALPDFIDRRTAEEKAAGVPPVEVTLTEFLDSGIELRFRVYSPDAPTSYQFAGKVREAVLKAFRKNNIVIPYPTRTVEIQK